MILDTTFLSDFHQEIASGIQGPAIRFLGRNRSETVMTTVISVGEIAVVFSTPQLARSYISRFRILRLTPEIALEAGIVDRECIRMGMRMGENDTWIAGFCRYYRQAVVSRDVGFDRVTGLRRLGY